MHGAATGHLYTHAVAVRVALIVVLLLASAACGSDGPTEMTALAAAANGPWQPVPIALPAHIVQAVDRTCRSSFREFPQHTQLMVIDARGAGRIEAQYAAPNGEDATCASMTIDADGRVEAGGGGTGSRGQPWLALPALELETVSGYSSSEGSGTSGRVGAGVVTVVIAMPGRPPVTASIENGWYLAWWPGDWPPGTKAIGLDSLGQPVTEAPVP